jgi:hypothetical protein
MTGLTIEKQENDEITPKGRFFLVFILKKKKKKKQSIYKYISILKKIKYNIIFKSSIKKSPRLTLTSSTHILLNQCEKKNPN